MKVLKNNKAQALIEFVMILPILLFIVFLSIDFGRIFYAKNHLENLTTDVIDRLEAKEDYDSINKYLKDTKSNTTLSLSYKTNNYLTIKLETDLVLFTPGLNKILKNPYNVVCERTIRYE